MNDHSGHDHVLYIDGYVIYIVGSKKTTFHVNNKQILHSPMLILNCTKIVVLIMMCINQPTRYSLANGVLLGSSCSRCILRCLNCVFRYEFEPLTIIMR